jgi:hypothetical protein
MNYNARYSLDAKFPFCQVTKVTSFWRPRLILPNELRLGSVVKLDEPHSALDLALAPLRHDASCSRLIPSEGMPAIVSRSPFAC